MLFAITLITKDTAANNQNYDNSIKYTHIIFFRSRCSGSCCTALFFFLITFYLRYYAGYLLFKCINRFGYPGTVILLSEIRFQIFIQQITKHIGRQELFQPFSLCNPVIVLTLCKHQQYSPICFIRTNPPCIKYIMRIGFQFFTIQILNGNYNKLNIIISVKLIIYRNNMILRCRI